MNSRFGDVNVPVLNLITLLSILNSDQKWWRYSLLNSAKSFVACRSEFKNGSSILVRKSKMSKNCSKNSNL
jgi:hypothetical protein